MIRIYSINGSKFTCFMDINEEVTFCIYSKGNIEIHKYLPPVSKEENISFEHLLKWLGDYAEVFIENMEETIIERERAIRFGKTRSGGGEICYA